MMAWNTVRASAGGGAKGLDLAAGTAELELGGLGASATLRGDPSRYSPRRRHEVVSRILGIDSTFDSVTGEPNIGLFYL